MIWSSAVAAAPREPRNSDQDEYPRKISHALIVSRRRVPRKQRAAGGCLLFNAKSLEQSRAFLLRCSRPPIDAAQLRQESLAATGGRDPSLTCDRTRARAPLHWVAEKCIFGIHRRVMPRFAAFPRPIVGLSAFLVAAAAAAQSPTGDGPQLDWQAPAGCPGREAVLERTKALTSRTAAPGEAIRARGLVTARPDATGKTTVWHLTLETTQRSRSWQRSVEATSCEELMEAGALILALAIDPSLDSESGAAPATSEPPIQELVQPPRSASPPPPAKGAESRRVPPSTGSASAPRNQPKVEYSIEASAIGDFGSLPRPALGVEGAIGVAASALRLEAVGTLLPEVRREIAQEPSRGGNFGLWALGARGSYGVRLRSVTVEGRLGFESGKMRGTGFGGSAWNTERTSLWAAARAGVAAYLDWGQFRLSGAVEAGFPIVRPEFVFEGLDQVHQPAVVVGRVAIGVGVHF